MTKFPSEKELKKARRFLAKAPASRMLLPNATPVDRAKYAICAEFVKYKNNTKITQRDLAEKLGIDEALVSKITHYNFDDFTTDRLINYLSRIYPKDSEFLLRFCAPHLRSISR